VLAGKRVPPWIASCSDWSAEGAKNRHDTIAAGTGASAINQVLTRFVPVLLHVGENQGFDVALLVFLRIKPFKKVHLGLSVDFELDLLLVLFIVLHCCPNLSFRRSHYYQLLSILFYNKRTFMSTLNLQRRYHPMKQPYILCDRCGAMFHPGNRPDGIPNGVTLILDDGHPLTLCADCIIKQGAKRKEKEGTDHDRN